MELKALAQALGIDKYPDCFEEIYKTLPEEDYPLCDLEAIARYEEEYSLLGKYYDVVVNAAKELPNDRARMTWAKLLYRYNQTADENAMRTAPVPATDETLAGDLMPLLVLLPDVPRVVERYKARGFTDAQIKKNLEIFKIDLRVLELLFGRPLLTKGHYNWTGIYMYANIFDHKSFNYHIIKWNKKAMFLRNKNSGEYVPVMTGGKFHKSGLVFGSIGAMDEDGAYDGEFIENEEEFIGHAARDSRIEPTPTVFKKSEWECVLREGDDVVNLHIPRNTKMDYDYVREGLREGFALAKKHYPECNFKFLVCSSWLLDKGIVEIIGEEKNLSKFINLFLKFPIKTNGLEGISYVFPGCHGEVKDYPEDTTLQRGYKKLLLDGDSLHMCAGAIFDEELYV